MYQRSARVIQSVIDKKGDPKTILYRQSKSINPAVYALVFQTLKYQNILEEIISSTPSVSQQYNHKTNQKHKGLILLLIYELLFGSKSKIFSSSSSSKRFNALILKNKSALHSALVRIKIKKQISDNNDLVSSEPQYLYARVNTLLSSLPKVMQILTSQHTFKYYQNENEYNSDKSVSNPKSFWHDEHIPNLLVFTAECKIAKLKLILDGYLIIQNKSSCLSSYIMDPKPDWTVLDACAAPGNKTSHLLCIMNDKKQEMNAEEAAHIVALDHDSKRCRTLKERIKLFGMEPYIQTLNRDFLSILPSSELGQRLDAILLDPTCSGSGLIHDRLGHFDADKKLKIPQLSDMQKQMLIHAMRFEHVQRIVYSTCSVHHEENEEVVQFALDNGNDEWELIKVFDAWKERGLEQFECSECVVRVSNDDNNKDLHGFFVACFQRKPTTNIVEEPPKKKRKLSPVCQAKCCKKWKVTMTGIRSYNNKNWTRHK